jgi:glycosyltransferase involved in cell wall biosynthesis
MKLAYLVNQYPKVSHAFIRREILALAASGVDVARFSVRPPTELVDAEDRAEATRTTVILDAGAVALLAAWLSAAVTHPIRMLCAVRLTWRLGRRSARGVMRHFAYLAEAAWLRRALARAEITHLHAHFGTNSTAVAMLCRALGGPRYSFTVHGPEEFDQPEALSLCDKIADASAVVAITAFAKSQLYRWARYSDWPKVHVVHCAVDEHWLRAPPLPIDGASHTLVCVGRLCAQKGQALLVEAAARLARAGETFRLVLVGDGEMRADLEALIARHGLGERVTITGWAHGAEVRRQLAAARALVLPSFAEGLPVVLMEALALGRPVITTAIAGIPELVRHGENGWLIVPGDIEAAATAMREALRLPAAELERMGRAGRATVAVHHAAVLEAHKLVQAFGASEGRVLTMPREGEGGRLAPPAPAGVEVRSGARP